MAVYTKVTDLDVQNFLANYELGELRELIGIKSGISNSNFVLLTDAGRFILTIYEDRTPEKDLPFFLGLMNHLAVKGVPCPVPMTGHDGLALRRLAGKPAAVVSFLEGKAISRVDALECAEMGKHLAKLHNASRDFPMSRDNDLSLAGWDKLFSKCLRQADTVKVGLADYIRHEMSYLKLHWPQNLPKGVIHADLFPDNVFFDNGKLCGLIDFYFACTDYYSYDLAICLNAWCFEPNNMSFNLTKARALIEGYCAERSLSKEELQALPILCRGASVRFLATRLYDWLNQVEGAFVKAKNPLEYLERLQFHQKVRDITSYGVQGL